MKSIVRKSPFIFPLLLICTLASFGRPIQTPTDGIIATGTQISQVRFMLEVYSTIGAGIKYRTPKDKLQAAILEYEHTLAQLDKMQDPPIQASAKRSHMAWAPVKKALLTALEKRDPVAMKKSALFVHANIRKVIQEMEIMKEHFLQQAKMGNAKEINAGIEIAASARRLSSHYMMKMWNLPDPTIDEHWNNGMKKYHNALIYLRQTPLAKDTQISTWLTSCETEYSFFKTVIKFGDNYMPVLVQRHAQKAYDTAGKIVMKLLNKKH
jgi:hypothetical protein